MRWTDLPDEKRSSVAATLARRINQELVTDGVVTQEEWVAFEDGGPHPANAVSPGELDGYYAGRFAIPPLAAKYADMAARQNGIWVASTGSWKRRRTNVLAVLGAFVLTVGLIEWFVPIPFFASSVFPSQYPLAGGLSLFGAWWFMLAVLSELIGGS